MITNIGFECIWNYYAGKYKIQHIVARPISTSLLNMFIVTEMSVYAFTDTYWTAASCHSCGPAECSTG